jgi:hypothetical protein
MKKFSLICFLSLVTWSVQAQTGIEVGAVFNSIDDVKTSTTTKSFDSAQGWHIGVFANIGKGFVGFRPGIRYTDGEGLYNDITTGNTNGFKVSSIEIPLDLRFRINTPVIKPYLVAGPLLRFPISADNEDFKNAMENFNLAASVGGGIELKLGGLHLYPELNYTMGVTRFVKNSFQIGSVNFNLEDESKLNNVVVKVGVAFN